MRRVLLIPAYRPTKFLNFVPQILDNRARDPACSRRHRSCFGLKRPPSRLVFVPEFMDLKIGPISMQNWGFFAPRGSARNCGGKVGRSENGHFASI